MLQPSNPSSILLEPRSPSSSNFHRDRGRSFTVLQLKISINLALSCPSSNISLFMSNSEDCNTPVDDNEQERDGSDATSQGKEIDLQPREVIVQTQRDLELSLKKKSIIGVYHKIWQATQMVIWRNMYRKKMSKR